MILHGLGLCPLGSNIQNALSLGEGRQRWHFSHIHALLQCYCQLKQPSVQLRWVTGYTKLPQAIWHSPTRSCRCVYEGGKLLESLTSSL